MPKRRGGKNSEQARRGGPEPDAEHSGSEDEPMGEPPLPTPYVRMLDGEAQTAAEAAKPCLLDAEAQTPGKSGSIWGTCQSIPGYTPRGELDRVMVSRAALHEHEIILQCAQCKAGTLTEVVVVVALCAPLPCKRCGYTLMRPAGPSDKAAAAALEADK